jgi:ribosomal protein S12 methylthiotransferase
MQFDRVGCFTYSPQEGTRAFDLDDDVDDSIKRERKERVEELQRAITSERYERFLGRETRVLVDRAGDTPGTLLARAPWQADDIDGMVHLTGDAPIGSFVDVRIDAVVDDFDFRATWLGRVDSPSVAPRRPSRELPMVGLTNSSAGSYGR